MVYTHRFLSPLAGSIALLALFACGKIDTPKLVDPYANVTGKSLSFDVDPPLFGKGLDSATRGACGNILLEWTPVADSVSGSRNIIYYIYQTSAPGAEDFNSPSTYQTTQFDLSSYLVQNLSPATTYYFVVRAVDEAGNQSVIDPNSLVERSVTTQGTRGGGAGPNLYCPGGYAGESVVLAGTSVAGSTTVSFSASPSPVSLPVTQISNSEVRAIVPANIQTGAIQVNPPGGPYTADAFLFFPPGQNISNNIGFSTEPAIAVSGLTIGMVWTDSYSGTGRGGGVILFSYSTDGGQTFSAPLPISDPARISSTPHLSFGVASPPTLPAVYVAWTDFDSANNNTDVYFSRSLTGSLTSFTAPANLSANAGASLHPRVTSSVTSSGSGTVAVVWDDNSVTSQKEIFYRQSSDGGQTFGAPAILSSASASGHQAEMPELVQSGNNLTIAWKETQSGIHVIQSSDGGASFSPAVISPFGSSLYPHGQKMTLDGAGNIYMVWEDTSLSPVQISMVKFPVNTLPDFNTSVPLSASGSAANPSITAVGNLVIAVWIDQAQQKLDNKNPQKEIFLISSPDGGVSFTPPVNFSSPFLDSSENPMLVNDGSGTMLMAWQQWVPPTGSPDEKSEVFFSRF
ncbi:MAG: fibronectin type III domain-containing protein [Nitrospirae bacterium]|nr:fibronectin type III domain-containing protein [Nitrospirota bacterium]